MGFLFRLILLALVVYGGWQLWQNYDLETWYANCKNAKVHVRACLQLPVKRGSTIPAENIFTIRKGCVFEPARIEINHGEKVYWLNESGVSLQLIGTGFQTDPIASGKTFSKNFKVPGTVYFTCEDGSNEGALIIK
ncbi:MAG: hypothetical protein PHQ47_02935 [Candidatus Portnoybacteria bacterium]|nr:hypothetical protein [Candidatus Portnoybacteria bacterium]